ncbi:MAG: hypothetical protein AB8B56_05225 [Crocinitomicaceae bacterium]
MLKYIFSIAIAGFLLSCTSGEASLPEETDTPEVVEEDTTPQKEYDPSSVISRSEEFFDWYLENSRMLYKKRSMCIGAENGYHALDEQKLKAYTEWLAETNFFSEQFIEFEHNRWTTECAEEMREMARKKKHFKGPPPCVFEGDVFFKMRERPSQEMIEGLEYSVTDQTDSSAVVNFTDVHSLNWSFVGGTWKIDAWPR